MTKKNLLRSSVFAASVIATSVSFSFAQNPQPDEKPINVKKEVNLSEPFKRWIDEDVSLIITKEEKDAFDKLKTNEERENFIAIFWQRRDPDPDTEENEYREEFYERIAYANEHFASGIPGWKTDRGRIYIMRGKPDSIESHPSGGSYQRPSYEGGGSTTTYPFETWFYRHLDGVGDGLEIEFVDPTGTGEYRLARDSDEKNALANVPGAGQKTLGNDPQRYQRLKDTPFERLQLDVDLSKPPPIRDFGLETIASAGSGVFQNENPVDFDLQIDFFRVSEDRVITAFTIQSENKELSFKDIGGIPTAQMNIFGKVSSVSGKRSGTFEDSVSAMAASQTEIKNNKSIYQKALALQPGIYKIDVAVRDVETGKTGVIKRGFTVPKYDPEKLSTSTMILASRLYQTSEKDIGGQFIIGDKKVVPNLSGVYKKGQEIGVYLQVYNSGIDQITLRPAVEVEYILLKDGKEILNQRENWEGLSTSNSRLTLARLIPTENMSAGNYEIKIKILDLVNTQTLEPSQKFTIVQ